MFDPAGAHWLRQLALGMTLAMAWSDVVQADETVFEELSFLENPAAGWSQEPFLTADKHSLLMSWMTVEGPETLIQFARLNESGWSDPVTVTRGDDLFVNWADFPSVAAYNESNVALHWLRKTGPSSFDYNVELSISSDGGLNWSVPIVPHSDRSPSQHGFLTMSGSQDGALVLLWLDGRAYGRGSLQASPDAMQLRATRISTEGTLLLDRPVDMQTCSCCQTSSARLGDGTLVVAYRDRTDTEIRDISVARLSSGEWSEPVSVHDDGWELAGCPVNGPAIAAQDDSVAVAWFTGASDVAAVKLAFSYDGGLSFEEPFRIDLGDPLGRVDALFLADGSVLVSWLEWQGNDEVLFACRATADKGCVSRQELFRNATAGSMNFPRMARIGQNVFFAWTQPKNATHSSISLMRGDIRP